jgi:hypothetical protein
VEGTSYHAAGEIPRAMTPGAQRYSCSFGVVREGNGSGVVTITKPDGRTRSVFFEDGQATGADISEADPGAFGAQKHEDTTLVSIGDERYEIPDAVIRGDQATLAGSSRVRSRRAAASRSSQAFRISPSIAA